MSENKTITIKADPSAPVVVFLEGARPDYGDFIKQLSTIMSAVLLNARDPLLPQRRQDIEVRFLPQKSA